MDIVSDTYIRGGIPQSRYCRSCAHYQVLSGSSNSGGEPGPGCNKRITFAQWRESKRGRAVLRQKHSQSRPRKRRAEP